MKLNKAERMLKTLDRKVSSQLHKDTPGSVHKTIQESIAEKNMLALADRVKREGIE